MQLPLIVRRRRNSSAALSSNDGLEFSIAKAIEVMRYRRIDREGLRRLAVQPVTDLLRRVHLPLERCGNNAGGDPLELRSPRCLVAHEAQRSDTQGFPPELVG